MTPRWPERVADRAGPAVAGSSGPVQGRRLHRPRRVHGVMAGEAIGGRGLGRVRITGRGQAARPCKALLERREVVRCQTVESIRGPSGSQAEVARHEIRDQHFAASAYRSLVQGPCDDQRLPGPKVPRLLLCVPWNRLQHLTILPTVDEGRSVAGENLIGFACLLGV
jgi:hypothetical protein